MGGMNGMMGIDINVMLSAWRRRALIGSLEAAEAARGSRGREAKKSAPTRAETT
jgi:hypothetical protein